MHQINGANAIARRQHAVKSRGRAAPLYVSQDHGARLKPGARFNLRSQRVADAAQPDVPEFVSLSAFDVLRPRSQLGPFGYHHDAEIASSGMATGQDLSHVTNIKRSLRDQDYIGAAGHAAINGDP